MKKRTASILCALLSLLMVFSLASCGGSGEGDATKEKPTERPTVEGETEDPELHLYDDLPEEFSREQLDALLKLRGRRTPTRILICQWSKRGLIAPVGENRYRKVRS